MKYTIFGLQQEELINQELNLEDALIIERMIWLTGVYPEKQIDGKSYKWIAYSKLKEEVPIAAKNDIKLRRIMKKIEDKKIIERVYIKANNRTKVYFHFTEKLLLLTEQNSSRANRSNLSSQLTDQICPSANRSKVIDESSGIESSGKDETSGFENTENDTALSSLVSKKHTPLSGTEEKQENDVDSGESIPDAASCQQSVEESVKVECTVYTKSDELAEYFFNKIKSAGIVPTWEVNPPNYTKWSEDIEKMIRLDKREVDDIRRVIDWTVGNEFWQDNVKCGRKLREKYNTLFSKMKKDKNYRETHDEIIDSMQRRAKEIDEIINQDDEISRFARGMFSGKGGKNERINGNV